MLRRMEAVATDPAHAAAAVAAGTRATTRREPAPIAKDRTQASIVLSFRQMRRAAQPGGLASSDSVGLLAILKIILPSVYYPNLVAVPPPFLHHHQAQANFAASGRAD